MFICICNAISDKKLLKELQRMDHAPEAEELYARASGGVQPACCTCLDTIRDMIDDYCPALPEAAE